MRRVLVALLSALALAGPAPREPVEVIPWAWERREDLRFLGEGHTVAYYAGILTLHRDRVIVAPRRNPLRLARNTHRIAVIRIETRRPALDAGQREETLAAITRLSRDAEELQIDFDATRSERAFYRDLLVALRARIDVPLSITALASWCIDDPWLQTDAVPMLFRMGRDAPRIPREFPEPRCRASVGISVDEPLAKIPRASRVFIFNPDPWTEASWTNASSF